MTSLTSSNNSCQSDCTRPATQPVACANPRARGTDFPAAVVCELELNGYGIERVYDHRLIGVCLFAPEPHD